MHDLRVEFDKCNTGKGKLQRSIYTMRLIPILCGLTAYFFPIVSSTALTYKLTPNEKACFFTFVEEKGAKIAFYFAVISPFSQWRFLTNVFLAASCRFNLVAPSM